MENVIKNSICEKLNGETEIVTEYGDIDILTDNKIIEVKLYNNWKHALGQILAYSETYPEHTKYIYVRSLM